jgi:hypothetical protein
MSTSTDGLLEIPAPQFHAYFDRKPFYVGHKLAAHALFSLPELAGLAVRLPPTQVACDGGPARRPSLQACAQAILDVERSPCWVLLWDVQADARYGALLDDILAQVRPHAEALRPGTHRPQGFIFISSRAIETPFFADPARGFLLQIRGSEIAFCGGTGAIAAGRRPPADDRALAGAWRLPLPAGSGVHFPMHAPRWVRSDGDVSISLGVTFHGREASRRARPDLGAEPPRQPGLEPPAARRPRLLDAAAHLGARAFAQLRRRVHRPA